jgi:hypothetical protein
MISKLLPTQRNGRTAERQNGRTAERQNGRTAERQNGRTAERQNGRTAERLGVSGDKYFRVIARVLRPSDCTEYIILPAL